MLAYDTIEVTLTSCNCGLLSTCQQQVRTYRLQSQERSDRLRLTGINCQLIAEVEHAQFSGTMRRLAAVRNEIVASYLLEPLCRRQVSCDELVSKNHRLAVGNLF